MRTALAFLILGLALVAFACTNSGTQPQEATPTAAVTPTASAEPSGEGPRPPELEVALGDATVSAGIGTYCWTQGGQGACVDAVGIVTPSLALVGQGQPPLVAQLPDLPLRNATANAWRIDDRPLCKEGTLFCGALPVEGGFLAWPYGRLENGRELPVRLEGDTLRVISSLESGTYLISLSLAFEDGGDVNYGVLLALLPAEG